MQLPGNRKFEVNLSDDRIDLSKARRVEPRPQLPHLPGTPSESILPHANPHAPFGESVRGTGRNH
jgi:hypothetical protein